MSLSILRFTVDTKAPFHRHVASERARSLLGLLDNIMTVNGKHWIEIDNKLEVNPNH